MMEQRKEIERRRYDSQASPLLQTPAPSHSGVESVPVELRAPYFAFEDAVRRVAPESGLVVDLGAGTGTFSLIARGEGRVLVATDISRLALLVARRRATMENARLLLVCADAERLPFRNSAVDLVTSAGALYCFDLAALKDEVRRVLRPQGAWVIVDALNDNPIYRLNRLIGFLQGTRTRLTLGNVPTMASLRSLGSHFRSVDISCYGVLAFLLPVLRPVLGASRAGAFVDAADRRLRWLRRWSFKAVVVAKGAIP